MLTNLLDTNQKLMLSDPAADTRLRKMTSMTAFCMIHAFSYMTASSGSMSGQAANHLVVSIALLHVVQLPAVAKVEQELLDWAACIHLGIYPSIDAVKDPGYPNQQGGFHLSCNRQTGISESVLKQESPTNSILERV